jgi:hypothetical protein
VLQIDPFSGAEMELLEVFKCFIDPVINLIIINVDLDNRPT